MRQVLQPVGQAQKFDSLALIADTACNHQWPQAARWRGALAALQKNSAALPMRAQASTKGHSLVRWALASLILFGPTALVLWVYGGELGGPTGIARQPSPGAMSQPRPAPGAPTARLLARPRLSQATIQRVPHAMLEPVADLSGQSLYAQARWHNAPIFKAPLLSSQVLGWARRGSVLAAFELSPPLACKRGSLSAGWYAVQGGFICGAGDFIIGNDVEYDPQSAVEVDFNKPMPYTYARVSTPGALRFAHLPSQRQLHKIANQTISDGESRVLVAEAMHGDFFLALDIPMQSDGPLFYRTASGEFVAAEHVQARPLPPFFGEVLHARTDLPLAFVFGDDENPLFCRSKRSSSPPAQACGLAQKHARFPVRDVLHEEEHVLVLGPDGLAVPQEAVRIATAIDRPQAVGPGEKWVHIDLAEQTLVAYEGDQPVYATLVSSGLDGYDTPVGLFRTRDKYLSKTMRGKDRVSGIYHVEEVPWTIFYYGRYAVHGAYWHNDFGNQRSHGCTNLAPIDAQWLFHWESIKLPADWHANLNAQGAWLYFTRNKQEYLAAGKNHPSDASID